MPVVAQSDVEAILGRALTTPEQARVNRLLEMSEGALQDALPGFELAQGTETVDVWPRGDRDVGSDGTIWTPRYPVRAVTEIKVLDLVIPYDPPDVFGYKWDQWGRIVFAPWEDWLPMINAPWLAHGFTPYVVTYDFGFSSLPADLCSAIAAPVAALLRQQKANPDDLASENVGAYSVHYRNRGDLDPTAVGLIIQEAIRTQIRRWRRTRQVSVPIARHL